MLEVKGDMTMYWLDKVISDKNNQNSKTIQKFSKRNQGDLEKNVFVIGGLLAHGSEFVKELENGTLLVDVNQDILSHCAGVNKDEVAFLENIGNIENNYKKPFIQFYATFGIFGEFIGYIDKNADLTDSYDKLVEQKDGAVINPGISFDNIKKLIELVIKTDDSKIKEIKNKIINFINDETIDVTELNQRRVLFKKG